ncbi:MAG: energy transducer TonB [Candidatus Manganitrophaceae bacterium]
MRLVKKISGIPVGIFLSILIHAGFGGGFHSLFTFDPPPPIVAELDLSMTSLLPAAPAPPPSPPPLGHGLGSVSSAETTPSPTRSAVKKQAVAFSSAQKETPLKPEDLPSLVVSEFPSEIPEVPETPSEEEVISAGSSEVQETDEGASAEEEAVSVAGAGSGELDGEPGGVPGGVTGGQLGSIPGGVIGGVPGGQPGGSGRYLPASQVAQPPRWIGNLMTPRDYPPAARRKGKDGRVVMSVFIDETGRVREVRLLQGSDDILNEVALRKVREALFTPAYSQEGQPVACKVTLPIRFQLE